MAGYIRVDTGNNIADGNVISAADLDNEFDGIQAAFNASTGHNHDGTTGEGAPILVLGPTQDVVVGASTVTPKTTNTVDIGSSSLKFKDLYMAGNASIGGTLAVTGVATLTAQPILSSLTASRAVFTDGSKGLVSNAITGTGNVVMSASPTLTGTITAEALTTSSTVTLNGGTANGVAFLNGSKVLTTGSALTFDGTVLSNTQSSAASGVVANFANSTTGALLQLSSVGVANVRIGSPNADAIAFYTFGVGSYPEQMRLTSTGLGIGTSSPGYKLDVAVGTNTVSQQWQGAGTNFNLRLKSGSGATPSSSMYRLYLDYLNGTAVNSYIDFYRGSGGADGYLVFGTSGADKMTLDSSGNLGLGVTPSAGGSIYYKSFELGKAGCGLFAATASLTGSELTYVTGNAVLTYSGGPLWLYGNNGNAATYAIEDGNHLWRIAGSGTAGAAISFTQAMTLDASGNLGVGATSVTPIFGRTVKVYNAGSGGTLEVGGATVNARFFGSEGAAIAGIGTTTNTAFNFITNDTERARIDSSGGFLFRCTGLTNDAPNQSGGVFQQANGNTKIRVQSDGQAAFQFYSPTGGTSSTVGRVEVNATSTAYVTSSDYRLKEAVAPMTGALAKVAALKPCTYKWKTDGSDGEGFIAHELAEVVPDAVSGEKDAVNEDGSIKPQGIDTSFLVATLTAAIQEQQAIIESLKARLDAANL